MFGSRSKRHMSPATTLKKRSYKYTHSIDSNLPISVPAKHMFGRRHWITHVQDCEESESSSESSESSESLLLHANGDALSETPQLLLNNSCMYRTFAIPHRPHYPIGVHN